MENQPNTDVHKKNAPEWIIPGVLFIGVLLTQIILGGAIYLSIDKWVDRGTFGDMFGAINTLFSVTIPSII